MEGVRGSLGNLNVKKRVSVPSRLEGRSKSQIVVANAGVAESVVDGGGVERGGRIGGDVKVEAASEKVRILGLLLWVRALKG